MQNQRNDRGLHRLLYGEITAGSVVCLGLYLASLYNYLLFHSLTELFSIIIAMAVFMFAWNVRRYVENDFLVFLGIAYFFVSAIDMVHTLAYSGMNIFPGYGTNLPTQMWLAARYLQALSLLIAPVFLSRRLPVATTASGLSVLVVFTFTSVFCWKVFPVAFVEGVGLTPFKVVSEYLISLLLFAAAGLLYEKRLLLDRDVFQLMISAILITVMSELAFTLYTDPYGPANFVGHLFKILSFWLVYKAIIRTGLQKPYRTVFYELQGKEEALTAAKEQLEDRVRQRTAELAVTRDYLQQELVEKENLFEEIRESQKQLQFLWNTLPMMNFTLDSAGNVTSMNHFAVEQLGYQPEELMGRPMADLFHEEDQPLVLVQFEAIQQHPETIHEWELRKVHKDGHIVWVKEIARQAINPDGKIIILIACQDITARKKAEAVSRISEGKYQDLYDNAPDMYVSVDAASALIIDCNQTMVKMLGYAKDEIVGRPIFDMYDPDCRDDVKKAFQAFQETGEVHSAELQVRRKDGTRIDISLNVSAVRDGEGKVLYSRACWTDITDRKKKENEILRLNQELEERVAARTTELTEKAEDLSRSQQALQYLLEDVNQAKKELETKIAEIERMNRIFVHRELRMVELKEKIKEMEQEQHSSVGTDPGGRA